MLAGGWLPGGWIAGWLAGWLQSGREKALGVSPRIDKEITLGWLAGWLQSGREKAPTQDR